VASGEVSAGEKNQPALTRSPKLNE
jgi:hypothetical protein